MQFYLLQQLNLEDNNAELIKFSIINYSKPAVLKFNFI